MSCPLVSTCPLFSLFTLNASLAVWRAGYCDREFERCERHRRAAGGDGVPPNMLPNGKLLQLATPPRR